MRCEEAQKAQARTLEREIDWFSRMLAWRFDQYFKQGKAADPLNPPTAPDLHEDPSAYARQARAFALGPEERLILILALIPHLRPQALDHFLIRNQALDRPYGEFGGWLGKQHGGFLPTLETAIFVLSGDDLEQRLAVQRLLETDSRFCGECLVRPVPPSGEPLLASPLALTSEAFDLFTLGTHRPPEFSIRFPAHRLTTRRDWDDLVLPSHTLSELGELFTWIAHGDTLLEDWGMGRFLQPGFRALFHGPPGTGKTLAATLIGKRTGKEVYRIDLAAVISKFIGETEKNLAALFQRARSKNWILFFDEADALFAKRTAIATANDRHGNQEVAYLLQAIEQYPGVVILATNLPVNLDEAFARRFQSRVHFPMPGPEQRRILWQKCLREVPHEALDLERLAADVPLTGSDIVTVLRKAALEVLGGGETAVTEEHLMRAITQIGKRSPPTLRVMDTGSREEPWRRMIPGKS